MADLIKKVKVMQQNGTFSDYIPIGAEAINVKMNNNNTVEKEIEYIEKKIDNEKTFLKTTMGANQIGNRRDIFANMGLKWVRIPFVWESVEQEQGVIDDTALNGFKTNADLYRNLGINTIVLLVYNNTNYANDIYSGLISNENKEGFANFCGAVANKMKGTNSIYSIWNEPNANNFWSPNDIDNAYHYTQAFKMAVEKIRENDPGAKIAGPEITSINYRQDYSHRSLRYFKECCEYGLLDDIDYISFHNYRGKTPETNLRQNNDVSFNLMRGIARRYSERDIPMIITEEGGSTYTGGNLTEQDQANSIVRTFLINHAENIKITLIYTSMDSGTNRAVESQNFGMVYADNTLKPSGQAVKFLSQLLGEYYFLRQDFLSSSKDYCYVYKNDTEKKIIYVYWTTADNHYISLNTELLGCNMYSMYGEQSVIEDVQLEISASPCYIEYNMINDNDKQNNFITKEEVDRKINNSISIADAISRIRDDDLNISTNNIFKNSDLSQGLKYVTNWQGSASLYEDSELQDNCLKVVSTGQGAYFSGNYDVKEGDILTWSCWVRTDYPNSINVQLGAEAGQAWSTSNYTSTATGIVRKNITDKWQKIVKTFVVSRPSRNNFLIVSQAGSSSNPVNLYLYHPQLVFGTKIKEDFSPSLLDFPRFEIGTFTPELVVASNTNVGVNSYTVQSGKYWKLGELVYFNIVIRVNDSTLSDTSLNRNSSSVVIKGLPFQSNRRNSYLCDYENMILSNKMLISYISSSSSILKISKDINAQGAKEDLYFSDVVDNSAFFINGIYSITTE